MMRSETKPGTAAWIEAVLARCRRPGPVLILTQDNPDPDALASALALRELIRAHLRKRVCIGYGGICGRAENRAMIDVLRIDARRVSPAQIAKHGTICLVDAQPCAGNNLLDKHHATDIVIDHHLLPAHPKWTAAYADIRPEYGATSTILFEYLRMDGIPIRPNLATALFYGIQSDTQDLGREAGPPDVHAYQELFFLADKKKLARIRHAPVPVDYFRMLAEGLSSCVVAGSTVISFIQRCRNVDMIAEVADRMLRLEGIRAAVCYGICGNVIYLSARTIDARGNAAGRMKRVVKGIGTGGGHATMSGGQVMGSEDVDKRAALVRGRILKAFAGNKEPVSLLPRLQ